MVNDRFGFRIGPDINRTENIEIYSKLKLFGTPALSDGLNKFNTLSSSIKPIQSGIKIAGPAITVKLRPADNLMLHKAISIAKEGDVIVVDTGGTYNYSILGDLMATSAFKKGIAGFVIDGCIRDIDELIEKKFPVFTCGVTPAVGDKDGPGEINYPISCGNVVVMPGDYIVGDDNGVVVIPPDFVNQIVEKTIAKLEYEERRKKEIENNIIDKPDIDAKLRKLGIIE
ncbi:MULTISPECIES: RraA family protein [unclassified Facklamia]|uniref:RraA family protein n=1 Tax=Aerococcaceae TaxID=186827 RepID=UPI0013B7DBAB|nr:MULTISPECIES: RraA family protein [unclassified Facklamia]NEW64905.1 RraA family protein [Facklamia sp. 252]NEW68227.1 RraA family protein [Facklamia sp. 253]QQD66070.1 RraA family protein [Aerococcaceae bacterium zg-252]